MKSLAIALTALAVFASQTDHAASISIVSTGDNAVAADGALLVTDDDQLTLRIIGDFSAPDQGTLGGWYDVVFDPARLVFDSFVYNDDAVCDPGSQCHFVRDPILEGGRLRDFQVSRFNGITQSMWLSEVSFIYRGGGYLTETTIHSAESALGGLFALDGSTALDVDYFGLTLREVPVPAAAWLLLSGLLGLRAVSRRETR